MFPDGKARIDSRGSSPKTNRFSVGVRKIKQQQAKTSNKNDGPTAPGVRVQTEKIKKMSLASMLASAERLSKNLERKMSKPILKNESKVNANDMQIKKVPKMVHAATVPRRSVLEVTKTRLLVPLTPEPARLNHPCIHENTAMVNMPSKKEVAVQTIPLPLFQLQQPIEMGFTDSHPTQPFSRKTLNNDAPFKDIVKKFDKFLRKNTKTTMLFKKYIDNLSARRIVAAASNHNYRKYLMYFFSFSIGVTTTYMLNYSWHYLQRIENLQHLLQ